jgi:predicted ester cyclase
MTLNDQRQIARRALEEVCSGRELDAAAELYDAGFIDHVNELEFHGLEGVRQSVALYLALFPDLRIHVDDQIGEMDRVVSRWTMKGTYRGKAVTLTGITISRFANGKITEDWTVTDNLSFVRQLGLRRSAVAALRYRRVRR